MDMTEKTARQPEKEGATPQKKDKMSPEMRARFEASFKRNEEALRRLAKL